MTTASPQPSIRYPDGGHLLEDASVLRNAVTFVTKWRAFSAQEIMRSPDLESYNSEGLSCAVLNAFSAEMTASEDFLGWMFVFRDWKPGTPDGSLLALHSKVRVGQDPYSEKDAEKLLGSLDEAGLRRLLHIPTDEELGANGFDDDLRFAIAQSVTANFDGLRRITKRRLESDRGFVVAFNNIKHLPLAFRTQARGQDDVLIPRWLKKHPSGRPFVTQLDGIHLQNVYLEASADEVRLLAGRAVIGQAVLNSLLGLVLWARFGEPYETPLWVVHETRLRGWIDDDVPDQNHDT
jgi:hypothetical protein